MIIVKAPFRISFFGGGTDYQPFFEKNGGSVISTTFDKYCYVTIRHQPPYLDFKNHIVYAKMEKTLAVDDIEHPLVRNAMQYMDMHELRIVYDSDLPARSGIGSSSSFAVALVNGFSALKGKYISKKKIAQDAIYIERILCGESGGWQDQIAAAYGGLNRINFSKDGFSVNPIVISKQRKQLLNCHLMLFFTGFSRLSHTISDVQMKNTKKKEADLLELLSLVNEGENILTSKCNITEFGHLLDYSWQLKRSLTDRITTDAIDSMYQSAKNAGAIGGKLIGAGGGGFMLLFVEPDRQQQVKESLKDLLYVPFEFENDGVQILYYVSEDYDLPCK